MDDSIKKYVEVVMVDSAWSCPAWEDIDSLCWGISYKADSQSWTALHERLYKHGIKRRFSGKNICKQTQPEADKPQCVLNSTWRCSRESVGCIDWSRKQRGPFQDKLGSKYSHEHQEDVTKRDRPQHGRLLSVCKAMGGKERRKGKLGPEQTVAILGKGH